MPLRALVLIVLIAGISLWLRADDGVVAINGDRFAMVKSTDPSGETIHALQRTSPQGEVTTLWRETPHTGRSGLPRSAPLSLSPIAAICDEGDEISLLVLYAETDAMVFRFASAATQATPVSIRFLRRPGDPSHGLRFKHHGELLFEKPVDSIEKLVRFDANGKILSDFRPLVPDYRISDPRVAAKPAQNEDGVMSFRAGPDSQPSASSRSTNSQSERTPEPPLAAVVEPPLGSTSWPLWGGILLGTLALAYLFFKRREPQG